MRTTSLFILALAWNALAVEYRCPESIETEQKLLKPSLPEWSSMNDRMNRQQRLEQISVFSGHPRDGASLVPDNVNEKNDPFWTLERSKKETYWIGCFYSQSTVRLVREIAPNLTRCTLVSKSTGKHSHFLKCN
jgi:hypothetical protein